MKEKRDEKERENEKKSEVEKKVERVKCINVWTKIVING